MTLKNRIFAYLFLLVCIVMYVFIIVPVKEKYFHSVLHYRNNKDYYFKNSEDSPLEENTKGLFSKLKYFPLDKELIVDGGIRFYEAKDTISMEMLGSNTNEMEDFIRYGKIIFSQNQATHQLDFFKHIDEKLDNHFFIPFSDQTNNQSSFQKGRYIDLIFTKNSIRQTIDFNLSYNPLCAYNSNYNCPIPPQNNVLPFQIEAGEMRFPLVSSIK